MLHAHQSTDTTYYHYYSAIEQTVPIYKKLLTSINVYNQFLLLYLRIQAHYIPAHFCEWN